MIPSIEAPLLSLVLAGAGIVLAAAQDLKTREVPDSLSSGLAVVGFALSALFVAFGAPIGVLFNSVLGFAFGYAFGALLYFAKLWGGGDAKLLAGVGALIGMFSDPQVLSVGFSSSSVTLALVVVAVTAGLVYLSRHEGRTSMIATGAFGGSIALLSLFVKIGSFGLSDLLLPGYLVLIFLSGAAWAGAVVLYLAYRHRASLKFAARERWMVLSGPLFALLIIAVGSQLGSLMPLLFALSAFVAIAPLLMVVSRKLERTVFMRSVEPSQLVLGDWLAQDLVDVDGSVVVGASNPGLSKVQIDRITKLWHEKKIKSIVIKDGIAFVPAFVIAFVVLLVM